MFGLVPLQHQFNPTNTLEKFIFLVEKVPTHMHKTTSLISFVALSVLVVLRSAKGAFKKYPIIYRLPEVLIVVVVSTCTHCPIYRQVLPLTTFFTVLSVEFGWDEDGVEILGNVPINTGKSFVHFPLHHKTLRYLRKTTSTAV